MSYVIVGIHGLANKPPAKVLEKWWRQAILDSERLFLTTAIEHRNPGINSLYQSLTQHLN